MKDFVAHLKDRFMQRPVWFDKLTFFNIFLLWAVTVILFGFGYYVLTSSHSYLFYQIRNETVHSIYDSVYFSFITATTTGFGDIVPIGLFKALALAEVIFGLLLLALVTSKLVSIKQDVILGEIYEMSFNEKITRIRSSLLLFRQNLGRIMFRVEESAVRSREINDFYLYLSNFEDILNETIELISKPGNRFFAKTIDKVNAELIFNSVHSSFDKIYELIVSLNEAKLDWKRETTIFLLGKSMSLYEDLFHSLKSAKLVNDKILKTVEEQKANAVSKIKEEMAK